LGLRLVAPSGATVLERHALPRGEYGGIVPGVHPLHLLEPALSELVGQLIREYEQGFTVQHDDVVDAELVDETTTEED
jgi:hypothetical protein